MVVCAGNREKETYRKVDVSLASVSLEDVKSERLGKPKLPEYDGLSQRLSASIEFKVSQAQMPAILWSRVHGEGGLTATVLVF